MFRHSDTVDLLWNYFKTSTCFLYFSILFKNGLMDILDFKLFTCQYTCLEDDGHGLSGYQTFLKIKIVRYIAIYKVIGVILLINLDNRANSTNTRRIDCSAV